MNPSSNPPFFAPSSYHRGLMAAWSPELSYAGGDVAAWQETLRERLRTQLGYGLEIPAPLAPRTLWVKEHPLGRIEKVVFGSEAGADVMAYVCLPRGVEPPYDFWICLQGHSTGAHLSIGRERENEDAPAAVVGDRDFGLECMRRGLAALCLEQRAFGERREPGLPSGESGCHAAAMHALMLGKTLAGERVFDVERALDYLTARGDARPGRIGLMGQSGGGTITAYAAALLPRVAFAMPSCSFCTFADSIMRIYHCEDNYVPGLLRVAEMADFMGLFAPRPVTVVAGATDSIFPLEGVKRAFSQLQRIYRAAGAPDACRLVVGKEGHRFYADAAWPVMQSLTGAPDRARS